MSSMALPYSEPLVPRQPAERRIPEPPRRGEPGGPPCGISPDPRAFRSFPDVRPVLRHVAPGRGLR